MSVKAGFRSLLVFCCSILLPVAAHAQTRFIRLQNQTITTERGKMAARGTNVSGMFLVQFEGHPQKSWRLTLQQAGIDLVKYVPDDAYIARFRNVSIPKVAALNFVHWLGAYDVANKIHRNLTSVPTNAAVAVNVMLAPGSTAAEIARARANFHSIDYESHLRQGVIIRGVLKAGALPTLAGQDATLWIEPAPHRRIIDEAASKLVGGDDGQVATPTTTEQEKFGGSGVTVCVCDTGLDSGDTNNMHPDMAGRVTGFQFYPPLTDGSDGYGHGTHCAGIVAGNAATGETDPNSGQWYGLGVASSAQLFVERIFDADANEVSPAPSDEQLTQDAVRAGSQIQSDSWGNDVQGAYDTDASQFDELVRDADAVTPGDQQYILEFSAGNAGPGIQTLDSPASGKNVIATGACENTTGYYAEIYGLYADGPDTVADFSSCGPAADGRIKPDLVAPGTWIASAASSAAGDESGVAWTVIDNYYVYMGGTSMSGPAAAGAAADFVQYYKTLSGGVMPSPALVKAALINCAVELNETNGGPGPIPNDEEGWGRIALTNLIDTTRAVQFLDQSVLLSTGDVYEQHVFVKDPSQQLKITMAYTDVPGFPGASPALVNDLDLEVVAPDGTLYRGNQFLAEDSAPNPPNADHLNNVEAVHLSTPLTGDYLVRVRASNVPEDARLDTAAIDQDFALVASGGLVPNGQGVVLLDRTNYTAPAAIHLSVLDAARAGQGSVQVQLSSATEPSGESITLNAAGDYGAFTAAVLTVNAPAAPDGKLEIHQGDWITAAYQDSSGATRTAAATANLTPPVISAVDFTTDQSLMNITWQTSEGASSIVYFGTNKAALNQIVSDPALTTSHSLNVNNLIPGATYYYVVVSIDAAGNVTTNNDGGADFSFIAVSTPAVLLVDAYETADGSPVIPDSAYTNAIAAAGFTFEHWKVTERGAPVLSDVIPYHIVIWRTTDDTINYEGTNYTLTPQQQAMIQTYVQSGGSFFMSSMGILNQLAGTPFCSEVLHVAQFREDSDIFGTCDDCDEDIGCPSFQGDPNSPIAAGLNVALDFSDYPSFQIDENDNYGPDFSDTFTPASDATPVAFDSADGRPCGMSYPAPGVDSPGRVVFLSFPIDAVPVNNPAPNNEYTLMRNILYFLDPGANGVGSITLNQPAYTVPSQVTVEVADSDLAGTGQAQAAVSVGSTTNRLTLTLAETAHAGLFRGSVALVATNTTLSGQLRARNGDSLVATYFDASNSSNVVATAVIDTTPPVLSDIEAATNVGGATITWTTSKPADSRVNFGRTTTLGQTIYDPTLTTSHALTLIGLNSAATYDFDCVSQDQAGNIATNNNDGAFFSFTTPSAIQLPWSDDFENNGNGWTVLSEGGSSGFGGTVDWTLGTPDTPLQTTAHSGANCWGSDLDNNQSFFLSDSYLASPPISLAGLSSATLTFWDSFDFSDFGNSRWEEGELLVSTNTGLAATNGVQAMDFTGLSSPDWEQESIDLTPFVGQTIELIWHYSAINIGDTIDGWLVDDVAITNFTVASGPGSGPAATGTVIVSRNLSSGKFSLTGPIGPIVLLGSGPTLTLSNAAPGSYSVVFGDVAFYNTPPSQSGVLTASNTLTLNGLYTFPDVNSNGISDLFEQQYHLTNATHTSDFDRDGMTDYQEFIAGTDPTNPRSFLEFVTGRQTNNLVTFQWSAVPGRMYQVQTSTNFVHWTPVGDWMQASGSPMTWSLTNSHAGPAQMFRVQVRP